MLSPRRDHRVGGAGGSDAPLARRVPVGRPPRRSRQVAAPPSVERWQVTCAGAASARWRAELWAEVRGGRQTS